MENGEPAEKRQRLSEDRLLVLDLFASIGDGSTSEEATCKQAEQSSIVLLSRLTDDADRHSFDAVGNALLRCGLELPYKVGAYAVVAGLLCADPAHPHSSDLARTLSSAVCAELASALRDGNAAGARRAARYIAELARAGIVSSASLVRLMCVLLEAASEELSQPSRGANNVHARGEFLANVAVSMLPWAGPFLFESDREGLEVVMGHVRAIQECWVANRWRAVAVGDSSMASEAFVELLSGIDDLRACDWKVSARSLPVYAASFAEKLANAPRVELDTFVLPKHSKLTRYSPPRFRLCLLSGPETRAPEIFGVSEKADQNGDAGAGKSNGNGVSTGDGENGDGESAGGEKDSAEKTDGDGVGDVEKAHHEKEDGEQKNGAKVGVKKEDGDKGDGEKEDTEMGDSMMDGEDALEAKLLPIDRYLLRQYVADILDNFVTDHVKGAERLLGVPMLREANGVIVETVFSEMCATPNPTNLAIYYGSVFVDLCKVKDSRLPIKLLSAVERLFQDAGSLDPEVFDRLAEWFSFHLSNFGYKWNWKDWCAYADADMVDKFPFRALFCHDVLERVVRLAYRDHVVKLVPQEMMFFLPPPIGDGNRIRFHQEINGQLITIVAGPGKQPAPVVEQKLQELLPSTLFEGDEKKANLARIVALMRAILEGSSRTLSHFDTLVERYLPLLSMLSHSGGTAARKAITLEAGVFWSASQLRRLYVLDKMSMYRIIDGLAIIDFLLSDMGIDSQGEAIQLPPLQICKRVEDSAVWELTRLVLVRARSRLEGARAELTAASGAASHATEGDAEKVEERLNTAKAAAQNAKAEVSELVLLTLRRLFMLADMVFTAQLERGEKDGSLQPEDAAANGDSESKEKESSKESNGQIFAWRALGMMREMGRKHPEQIEGMLDELRTGTLECRERHPNLQEAFEVLEEIAGCDIAC